MSGVSRSEVHAFLGASCSELSSSHKKPKNQKRIIIKNLAASNKRTQSEASRSTNESFEGEDAISGTLHEAVSACACDRVGHRSERVVRWKGNRMEVRESQSGKSSFRLHSENLPTQIRSEKRR